MCDHSLSVLPPTTLVSRSLKALSCLLNSASSVGQTNVKSFGDRDTSVVGGSTDNEYSHLAWRRSHPDLENLGYPLIAAQKLSAELGILEKTEGYCLRATFVVDPHGVIQWVDVNQGRVGRNVAEVIRVLDALQSDELCPCNWKKGDPYVKVG